MALWAWPFALLSLLVAGFFAADPWLPLFPRAPGRRLTELFLRSLLVAYMSVLVVIPLVLAVSVWIVIRARRRGQRRPMAARLALLCGSAGLAVLGLELAASAWLAWVHRMPLLPTEFPTSATAQNELSLVVIGGSSATGLSLRSNDLDWPDRRLEARAGSAWPSCRPGHPGQPGKEP